MEIRSKAEFFALWEAGVLGNRPHLFHTLEDAMNSNFPSIGFRQLGRGGGGSWVKVPKRDVPETWQEWQFRGVPFIMDSGANDPHLTLEGEVCRVVGGWYGYLGLAHGLPMRKAMAAGHLKPRSGSEVLVLLNHYMDPSSRDDLDALLELYPDATVEFSCFDIDIGVLSGRNTIFWETRNY